MSTLLPPKEKFGANSDNDGGSGDMNHLDNVDYLELCMRTYPEAKQRAILSLIPGLGQLRNGELGKGALFLSITAANLLLVIAVVMSGAVTKSLTGIAGSLNRQPNFDLATPFVGVIQSPALFIYIALVGTFVWYAVRDAYDGAVQIVRDGEHPPRYALALPEAASGSYLAHFVVMTAMALLVIFFITPQPPKQQITVIELVKPEQPKPPEPKKPAPKREMPKTRVQTPKPIVVPKPVVKPQVVKRVEPPKVTPMPIAVATPTNEPSPFTTAPVAAAPAADPTPAPASSGGGSGTNAGGGEGGGGQDVDMGPWMRDLQRKIKKAWFPPKGNESKKIKVSFKVRKDGHVGRVKLISSSGVSIADDAATQAISDAAPFAALPDGAGDEVDINFTFDYNVFGSRK